MTGTLRRISLALSLLSVVGCASTPDELRESDSEEQGFRQNVRLLDPAGEEVIVDDFQFANVISDYCDRRLRAAPAGANACTLATSSPCSTKLCDAQKHLCAADLLLEIRGLHGDLRLDLRVPRGADGGTPTVIEYSVPQQTVGANGTLAMASMISSFGAMDSARAGLENIANRSCALAQSAVTLGDGTSTLRAALAEIYAEGYRASEDGRDAAAQDFVAASAAGPEAWPNYARGAPAVVPDYLRQLGASIYLGPLMGGFGLSRDGMCSSGAPAGSAATALHLFREAGLNPSDITGSATIDDLVFGTAESSLRNRLSTEWDRDELSASETTAPALTNAELLDVWGVTIEDLEEAREYLKEELRIFHRDQKIKIPGSERFAATALPPDPPPPEVYALDVRRANFSTAGISPSASASNPREVHPLEILALSWSALPDLMFMQLPALLGRLPDAVKADEAVMRPLSTLLAESSDVYAGRILVGASGNTSTTQVRAFLPTAPGAPEEYVIVNNESALSCLTRGTVESIRCAWPTAGVVFANTQTIDAAATALPVELGFPAQPAASWQSIYLLRLRPDGHPRSPGQYEALIGAHGPAVWASSTASYFFPIIPLVEQRVGEMYSPSAESCDRAALSCTGLYEDSPIALEDDLSADGDPRESSWRDYLRRAREAAIEADMLGEAVLEAGETIDQRAELATQALQELCGAEVDIDPLTNISLSELRGEVTCPMGGTTCVCSSDTQCSGGFRCQNGACVRDIVDLLAGRPEPGFRRLEECVAASEVVDFVALGSRPVCVWYETNNPNAVCTGADSRPCPFEPMDGTTLAQQCPVPNSAVHTPRLIEGNALLGFFSPPPEADTTAGGVPPCAEIRAMRRALADGRVGDAIRNVGLIRESGFFSAPNSLRSIGAGISWAGQPYDFSTLSWGTSRITTGDFRDGPNPGWPCTSTRADGDTVPAGCETGAGLLCESTACGTAPERAAYNDRLARAAILARVLTGNDIAGFTVPFYPRFDAEDTFFDDEGPFHAPLTSLYEIANASDVRDYRPSGVLRVGTGVRTPGAWQNTSGSTFTPEYYAAPFFDMGSGSAQERLNARAYARCVQSGSPLWHTVDSPGSAPRPLADGGRCNDPILFVDHPGWFDGQEDRDQSAALATQFWMRSFTPLLWNVVAGGQLDAMDEFSGDSSRWFIGTRGYQSDWFSYGASDEYRRHCLESTSLTEAEALECCYAIYSGILHTGDDQQDAAMRGARCMVSASGNGAFIGRYGFNASNLLDATELLCAAGGTRSAGCDFDHPPAIRTPEDLPLARNFLSCLASDIERRGALTVFARMPKRALDAMRLESSVGSFPAVGGEYGEQVSQLRGGLRELGTVPSLIASELNGLGTDVDRLRNALAGSELVRERAQVEFLSNLSNQITECATAVAGVGTVDVAAVGGRTVTAAITCANSFAQVQFSARLQELTNQGADNSDQRAVIDYREAFQRRADTLTRLAARLGTATEEIDAALAQLETLRMSTNSALTRALMLSQDGAGTSYHINTVLRARYDARRIRYERARTRAMRLAFLARRALEQRLGVRLSSLHEDLGVVEAPARWADDLCTMDAIDYRRLRDSTSLPRGTIDASIALSNGYIGDYVNRLELISTAYSNTYPYTAGEGTTVFSLRDQIQTIRAECPDDVPGPNLLYQTESLAPPQSGTGGGWEAAGCNEGDGACVFVEPLRDEPSVGGGVLGFGLARPFRVVHGPLDRETCEGEVCTPQCTATQCECTLPSCRTKAATEWRQRASVGQGRYRISWYARDVAAPIATSGRHTVTVRAVQGNPEAAVEVTRSTVFDRDAGSGWVRYWAVVEPSRDSTLIVSVAPRDEMGNVRLIGATEVAGVMLEDVTRRFGRGAAALSIPEPPPFIGTGATRASTLPACEDTDGSVFRRVSWRRGCERLCPDGYGRGCELDSSTEHCFWETQFTISQDMIERSPIFQDGSFAIGNYNYRMDALAVNLVGTGVRDCTTSPTPSSCYSTGVVPFSLTHLGPYRVRNHWGETYDAPLFTARIEHGQGLAAERYLTVPISSTDRSLVDTVTHHELRGRPLDGTYVLRIWESNGVNFDQIEDVQIFLQYYYWTRGS